MNDDIYQHLSDVKIYTDVGQIMLVDIDAVNPYDNHHFPFNDKRWKLVDKRTSDERTTEKSHREGTDYAKERLRNGDVPRPILVFNGYRKSDRDVFADDVDWTKIYFQRLDGFKRYMAMKELGVKQIVVHVVNTWAGGGQVNQSMFL